MKRGSARPLRRVVRQGFPSLCRELALIPRNTRDQNGYYVMLGLHPWATESEIRRAYHRVARRFHPDGSEPNVRLFERYTEIYEVLSDPILRAEYHATPETDVYLDKHVRRLMKALDLPIPLEEDVPVLAGFDFYRIGTHEDDEVIADRWYQALVEDLGEMGYRQVLKLCLTNETPGYDPSTRIIYLPRTNEVTFPRMRDQLLSILSG
ncbi:putative DnaJ-like chaperone protein [Rhodococcus phage E3]|uniref:putative DnaJ-like chaperone protein n=1 Tax=Rhodococcus phage E3 TaxID=1007869 RepID=UPI0002C6C081|nr:putative DnaJ-like chaperone protein [Rhodococcus phage E3]AEQ21069.1 putative DnaJ-like chaperone protein [Rhodococcus phage E3]